MVIAVTHAQCASTESLNGLSREVETLRRGLASAIDATCRVDELTAVVAQLADAVNGPSVRGSGPTRPVSYLRLPADEQAVLQVLEGLCGWLSEVFLKYSAARSRVMLPECWCWHPDVVEELLWLWKAWIAAYEGPNASAALAGEWHERSRPGVVHRIEAGVGRCDFARHGPERVEQRAALGRTVIPAPSTLGLVASWWGRDRAGRAPEPPTPASPTPDPLRPLGGYR